MSAQRMKASGSRATMIAILSILSVTISASAIDPLLPVPISETGEESTGPGEQPAAVQYRIDSSQSRFMVKVGAGGLLSAFAHDHNIAIRDFEGRAQFTPGTVSPGSLQLTINASSLEVTDKVSADDRQKIEATMRKDVLDVDKYPQIIFNSTSLDANRISEGVYHLKIWGDLTLHGTTKSGLIEAQVSFGADRLRARGSFPMKQSDYGIKRVSVAGGTIKVKDDLRFTFDIVAHP